MEDFRAIQGCPACGSAEVPHLIVRSGVAAGNDLSWRCRQCHQQWSGTSVGADPDGNVRSSPERTGSTGSSQRGWE